MLHDIIFLVLGLVLLVGGANYMTDGAVSVARRFKVSNLMIGLTVVALGSSMPDIVVCVESALEHKTAIAVGEVVGANIFDLLLVVGIMGLVRPWRVSSLMRRQDLPILFIASFSLWVAGDTVIFDGYHHNIINRSSGILLLLVFLFYMWLMINASKNASTGLKDGTDAPTPPHPQATVTQNVASDRNIADEHNDSIASSHARKAALWGMKGKIEEAEEKIATLQSRQWFSWILIVGGLGALVVGGNWVVDGASALALKAGMSQGMVALTVVAIGNSLPDLVTSLTATLKGASGIALGNIVGACILNALLSIGISATITPLGADTIGFVDFLTLAGASLLLWLLPALSPRKSIGRFSGALLTALYIAYMVFTIIRG